MALKYCGSCNPHNDIGWLGSEIKSRLATLGADLRSTDDPGLDAVVLICGCPRACVDRPELRSKAPLVIVVAGETVDCAECAQEEIPSAVEQLLRRSSGDPTPDHGQEKPNRPF